VAYVYRCLDYGNKQRDIKSIRFNEKAQRKCEEMESVKGKRY
jgi:hypothetical protein